MDNNSSTISLNEREFLAEPAMVRYHRSEPGDVQLPQQQPFFTASDRLTVIDEGEIGISVNAHPLLLTAGQLLYTAKGSIVLISRESEDLELRSCRIDVTPNGQVHPHHRVFETDEGLNERLEHYLELIGIYGNSRPAATRPLQQALLADIFGSGRVVETVSHPSHRQRLFNRFIELVGEQTAVRRDVEYYATRLHVSGSQLMKTVRRTSGRTVLEWIDLRTVMQAKALLSYSDKTVAEVGYEVGMEDANYFSRYFKRQTGLTPTEYRKSEN